MKDTIESKAERSRALMIKKEEARSKITTLQGPPQPSMEGDIPACSYTKCGRWDEETHLCLDEEAILEGGGYICVPFVARLVRAAKAIPLQHNIEVCNLMGKCNGGAQHCHECSALKCSDNDHGRELRRVLGMFDEGTEETT